MAAEPPPGAAFRLDHLKDPSFEFATDNRRRLGIKRIVWFPWRDSGHTPPGCVFCGKTGLRAADGKAKPSWRAFTGFSKR